MLDRVGSGGKRPYLCCDIFGCCKLLRAFGHLLHSISQHDPKVLMFSVEMVRAFDQAFNDTERQGFLSLSRDLTSAMRCKFSFV